MKSSPKFDTIEEVSNKRQIDGENFINFCGLFRKHEL